MMKQIGTPSRWWPTVVHNSFDSHWSTAFVTIKLQKPSVALAWTIDSHISLKRDFDRCIRLQLVERTVLEQTKDKSVFISITFITFWLDLYHQLCLSEQRSYVVTSMGKAVKRGDSLRSTPKQTHVGTKARFYISRPQTVTTCRSVFRCW